MIDILARLGIGTAMSFIRPHDHPARCLQREPGRIRSSAPRPCVALWVHRAGRFGGVKKGRRVGIPWVRWVSGCAMAEHPFMPVRTSFHTVCLGVKTPVAFVVLHGATVVLHGATVRQRDVGFAFLRVTCNAGERAVSSVTCNAAGLPPLAGGRTLVPLD